MTTAYAPSPSKKPTYAPTPAPLADPTDLRGSLAALGRTGYEDMISWRARESRAAVSRGPIIGTSSSSSSLSHPLSTRRPLGFSRTEPVLSFAPIAAAAGSSATNSAFPQTTRDNLNVVYSDGRRADELRPMWETVATSRDDLDFGRLGEGSVETMEFELPGAADDGDDDGDGFDLDEVLGPSSSKLSFGAYGGAGAGAPPAESEQHDDSPSLRSPPRRTKKRAFEDVAAAASAPGNADEEMMVARTDVEDEGFEGEGSDEPAPLGFLAGPAGRRLASAGARGFARTQSLPASAFSGQMEF
ncbi:hypothetical protein JCM5296_004602 [Sporobolomyces johnsonii]